MVEIALRNGATSRIESTWGKHQGSDQAEHAKQAMGHGSVRMRNAVQRPLGVNRLPGTTAFEAQAELVGGSSRESKDGAANGFGDAKFVELLRKRVRQCLERFLFGGEPCGVVTGKLKVPIRTLTTGVVIGVKSISRISVRQWFGGRHPFRGAGVQS